MKKNILLFYLLILTVAFTVKHPVFAIEKSTFSESVCKDALITNLSDQGKDILSGAIMIVKKLRPLHLQVTLYHIFLAAMTEVHVDDGPVTYTNLELMAFLREHNLLEDFQNLLLNNLGLNRDHLDSLFKKKSDGTLILNTDKQFDHSSTPIFNDYAPDTDRLLTEMAQDLDPKDFPNNFFLYVLKFDNPIQRFFLDHLTEPSPSIFFNRIVDKISDRFLGGFLSLPDEKPLRIMIIKAMYYDSSVFLDAPDVTSHGFIDEDIRFVSFLNSQGERVPGKLIEINNYSVTVEDLNGHKSLIEGETLNTVFQDKSVRLLFQYPHNNNVDALETNHPLIVQRQGEGFSYTELEMLGDPAQDAFRRALMAGRFEGDERFISLGYDRRKLAKVISWEENIITLQVYQGNEDHNLILELRLPLIDNSENILRTLRVTMSEAAKDYFKRIEYFFNGRNIRVTTGEDYQFLSHSIPTIRKHNNTTVEMTIDLTDPGLRKWIRKATDIIKEKTGIAPGPQNLTSAQRIQIYRIFHEDIVPVVESPRKDAEEEYSYFRDLIFYNDLFHLKEDNNQNRFKPLGYVLDTKSAVCGELSAFGAILFSEYGLHTRYMRTSPQMMEMVKDKGVCGHAWIGVQRKDSSLEFIDTNSRIFWSTNLRLLRERYPEGLSHLSDDKLLSLSEEYILVTPPSLE